LVSDELKYCSEIGLHATTLSRGHIDSFLISPSKDRIAVTGGTLLIVNAYGGEIRRKSNPYFDFDKSDIRTNQHASIHAFIQVTSDGAYWAAWRTLPVNFPSKVELKVFHHWRVFGAQVSLFVQWWWLSRGQSA
jgi:hypothetical protein